MQQPDTSFAYIIDICGIRFITANPRFISGRSLHIVLFLFWVSYGDTVAYGAVTAFTLGPHVREARVAELDVIVDTQVAL